MKRCWGGLLIVLVITAWVGPGSARGLEPLVHDLRTGDEATRVRAVLALGHSGEAQAVEVLRDKPRHGFLDAGAECTRLYKPPWSGALLVRGD
jgi:hypothetical protein